MGITSTFLSQKYIIYWKGTRDLDQTFPHLFLGEDSKHGREWYSDLGSKKIRDFR